MSISTATFAVDEHFEVKGKDLSGSSAGGSIGGNPVGGSSGGLGRGTGGGGTGGGAGGIPMPSKVGGLTKGDPVKDDLGAELGKILQFLARDFDAAGEIWVKIETPTGYKIEVRITAQAKVTGKR